MNNCQFRKSRSLVQFFTEFVNIKFQSTFDMLASSQSQRSTHSDSLNILNKLLSR